jgi:hypothetical protein
MDDTGLKLEFAANLLRNNNDAAKAAFATTPNVGFALQMAHKWPLDPVVIAEKDRLLISPDAKSFLPSKEIQAQDIYAMATNAKFDPDDRLKAHRLYAEIMAFIEKPVPGTTTNILNQGVMIVKDAGTDADWQAKASEQQRALVGRVN